MGSPNITYVIGEVASSAVFDYGGKKTAIAYATSVANANERQYNPPNIPIHYPGIVSSITLGIVMAISPQLNPYINLPTMIEYMFWYIVIAAPIDPINEANIKTLRLPYFIRYPATYDPIIKVRVAELPTIDSIKSLFCH
jgi:hypothetical protein